MESVVRVLCSSEEDCLIYDLRDSSYLYIQMRMSEKE